MKPKSNPFFRTATFAVSMFLSFGARGSAADLYWDSNGATSGTGGGGNWTTANAGSPWRTDTTGGALGAWVDGNNAIFGGSVGAVTISSGLAISTPKISVTTNNYTLSGGTVAFGGTPSTPGIIETHNTTGFIYSSSATGSLRVQSTGNAATLTSGAPLTINGSTNLTSFELALGNHYNHIILGNAAALGTSSSSVKLSKGVLNLGQTDNASNFTYNAWATDMAGGTIRARYNTGTWTGASSLSADTQLMTRNAAGAKLVFSSSGTIQLNDKTLNLMASSLSSGIELNGVISGTGNLAMVTNLLGGGDNGTGITKLGAANLFSGTATTTLNHGTLALNNVNALQNAKLDTAASGTQSVTFVVASNNTYNIGGLAGSDDLAIGGNTISLGNKAGSHSFSGNISGTGGLNKVGASSTQSLSAVTNYSGTTNITAGTLALTGSGAINQSSGISINGESAKLLHTGNTAVSSAITLTQGTLTGNGTFNTVNVGAGTGGTISNNDSVAGAALTIGSLNLAGGANINLYGSGITASLNVTTLTNNSSAGQVVITANNAGGWSNGTVYNLIGYTTLGGTGANNFGHAVNNLSARQSATWGDTGSAITLAIAGDTPYWTGTAAGGKWNAADSNWKLSTAGTNTTFLTSDDVLFDDNATGTTTVDLDTANVAPSTTIFNNSTKDYTLTGSFGISGGNLTKNGTGSLEIATNNSYSGATSLNAGNVSLSGTGTLGASSNLSMNGASLDLGATNQTTGAVSITSASASGNTLRNGSLTGSSYAVSNTSGNVAISANLLSNGAAGFTKTEAGAVTLSGINTWTGATAIHDGSITLSGPGTLGSGAALSLSGGSLNLGGSSQTTGAVTISAAAADGNTISNGSLTGSSYAVSNTTGNVAISANLLSNGAAGFTKSGSGTSTLSGANTYTGTTSVTAGTLKAGSSTAFQNTGALSLANASGVVFDLNGNNAAFTTLTSSAAASTITSSAVSAGTDVFSLSAFATDGTGALFTDNGTRKLQVNLSSGGSGSWQATTNTNNTYSGGLVLSGSMRVSVLANTVGSPGAITSGAFGTGAITVNDSSQIWFAVSGRTLVNDVIVNGNAGNGNRNGTFRIGTNAAALTAITVSGNITANLADAHFGSDSTSAGTSLLLSGKLSGNSGFRFFQSSNASNWTSTLNNATGNPNDYSGTTTINSAQTTLALGAAEQIPNGLGKGNVVLTSGFIDLAGFNETINGLSGAGTVDNITSGTSNTLTLGDGNATGTNFSGIIQNTNGSLSLTKIGTGTQILSGASTYTGATLISNGTLQIGNGGATGSLSSVGTITNNGTFAFNHTGTLTQGTQFSNEITGSGNLTKTGVGTVILSGTNSYNGSTTVSNGELRVTSSNGIGGSEILVSAGRLSLDGGVTTGSGKTVTVNGAGANFFGALQGNSGNNTWEGNVIVGSTSGTRIGVNSGSLKISGSISGSSSINGLVLRPNTGTVLELSGSNSYLGNTSIISGTGEVMLSGGANRLPTGTQLVFGASTTSGILNLNGQNQEIAGLSVAGGTANQIKSTTAATLTVNTATASNYSGTITGSAALTKTGNENLTLTGANTYTGDTIVSGGTLAVNGSLGNTSTSVGSSATLQGSGSINGSVTILSGGTLASGNSIESLITGSLSLEALSTFAYEMNNDASTTAAGDLTNANGGLTLDPGNAAILSLTELGIGSWDIGEKITLISYTGAWNGGLFNYGGTLADNSNILFSGMEWFFNYDDTSAGSNFTEDLSGSKFVTMTAIPEPSITTLGGLASLALLRRRRVAQDS